MTTDNDCDFLRLHMKILEDSTLTFDQKKAMLNEIRKVMPVEQNRWTFRWIIWFLGAAVISVPLYSIILLLFYWCRSAGAAVPETGVLAAVKLDHMPAALLSIGSTALGALATFLTNYGKGNQTQSAAPNTSKAPSIKSESPK